MSDSIRELLDELPSDNITVKVLKALDFIVPGEWENTVGFNQTIQVITGEEDANRVMEIGNKVIEIYNDKDNGYHKAMWWYRTLDNSDVGMATAAIADKVFDRIPFFNFFDKLTPKADKLQSFDLSLKIMGELIAYSRLNGLPILNPAEFVSELQSHYSGPSRIRMAAIACIDGILPLGPDFLQKVGDILEKEDDGLENNPAFGFISNAIDTDDNKGFIKETFSQVSGWMDNLVSSVGLTPESLFEKIGGFIELSDEGLDYVAAFLDTTTNYFEHTGIQTVAAKLIKDAVEQV